MDKKVSLIKKINRDKVIKRLFFVLSISLTFISLHAGFYFYKAMFGLMVAILTSFTFETLRIATLFGFTRKNGNHRRASYVLYFGIAFVCSFASVASFHAKIIQNYRHDMAKTVERQKSEIEAIKKEHAKARESELAKINKDINWCQIKLAKSPNSEYWQRRLSQIEAEEKMVLAKFDSLLAYIPESDVEAWIERESTKLGLKREITDDKLGNSWAVSVAVREVWNMSEVAAKKLTAIIIVLAVEFGILMLAILSKESDNPVEIKVNGRLRPLVKKFGEEAIRSFIASSKDYYADKGRLPMARDLSRNSREIRKAILSRKLTKNDINELMGI